MTNISAHPELNQPIPRRVKMNASTIVAFIVMGFVFILLGSPALYLAGKDFYTSNFKPINLLVLAVPLSVPIWMLCSLWAYFRDKKLLMWGSIAPAKTFEGPEYTPYRSGRWMDVYYEFKDADGNSIEGKRRFPARNENIESTRKLIKDLDSSIVFYDSKNSNRNILYPSYYAVCLPPKQR